MKSDHLLFDIWETEDATRTVGRWQAMMVNYVAHFNTVEEAERFVEKVRAYRESSKNAIK